MQSPDKANFHSLSFTEFVPRASSIGRHSFHFIVAVFQGGRSSGNYFAGLEGAGCECVVLIPDSTEREPLLR
jgi:hypothetical protein